MLDCLGMSFSSKERPLPFSLVLGTLTLAGLLAVLASLQYHWLGQVSRAEAERLREGARARAEQLARDFDREVTRAFLRLQVPASAIREEDWSAYADRHRQWSRSTSHPGLVRDVLLVEEDRLRRFDGGAFRPVEWPPDLEPLRERLRSAGRLAGPARDEPPRRPWPLELVDDEIPALVIPIPSREAVPPGPGEGGAFVRLGGFTIVRLDLAYIGSELLPVLARRHFGGDEESDYALVVEAGRGLGPVVFRSDPPGPAGAPGDAAAGLLGLRLEDASEPDLRASLFGPVSAGRPRDPRRPPPGGRGGFVSGGLEQGAWRLVATHRLGSVDRLVAAARRRNLLVSGGILVLLAASAVLIVVSAQRARRLADRQLEFVAGVSHELRTPVTVICSAGENLADGVVSEPDSVRQYGRVVRDEGRRLAEMVEQVLDFAGTYSGRRAWGFRAASVPEVLEECLAAAAGAVRDSGTRVHAEVAPGLPPVRADRAALGRALQNLVQNAIKYGGDGRFLGVRAEGSTLAGRPAVRITVEDRGLGIAAAEVAQVFEPFFRGEEAVVRQIRGTGLGLSLVRRIAEAHGGTVTVTSEPGRGSAFALTIPALSPQDAEAPLEPSTGTAAAAR